MKKLTKFNKDTFVLDPTRPRLVDLLTEEEVQQFRRMPVNSRPVYLITEMNLLAYRILGLSKETSIRINIDNKFQEVLAGWNGMLRVENLRIPFPYTHVVNLLTFIFVFGAPFIYTSRTQNWAENDVLLFASLLLGVAFYGLEDMARKCQHPLGWDLEDHDLEIFGVRLNLDGQEMAKICGVQEPMEFMPYSELFDDLPDFFQVMSYKSYLQTTSVSMEGKIPLIPRRPGKKGSRCIFRRSTVNSTRFDLCKWLSKHCRIVPKESDVHCMERNAKCTLVWAQ
ncbi:Bestrophin/UPF0187 [Nannochloropsis gaditana]|uniref:Bestrophin/UPF0187 n=1 Tax=Nannochloropsis gaditana TaxID=72520 RepID=W7TJV7_9STRA|nr:Bestrophin/UPF0187 [Nannochloropsis gaditana]